MILKVNLIQLFFKTYFLKALLVGFITALLPACTEVKESEPTIYLIPEGYVGSLYIVFNAPNGQPPKYEGNSRVYHIPPSGVLVTQMDANEGWIASDKIQFFSVSINGNRKPISEVSKSTPDNKRAVYFAGLGYSGPVYGCKVLNQNFIVGVKEERINEDILLTIHEAVKLKNIDKKLFEGTC
ncbi:hypothetical protein EXT46_03075 [Pseudoalteromonas sp. CO325X]|uniref:DUF6843 domain-containing protein n=1 Tax=Pseudoalteromonas sp. CO325X TaxID=1777262 RepID=UPI0010233F8E|nr:hypothetical protein [Pseudoalteromonas sp. CO325X]RZF84824.1 hypothetical protein EXT46_03075 [Pseudoalteromonas sp. CO325X]